MSSVQHSTESVEHYTPEKLVGMARVALGRIDLDPASTHAANVVVQAAQYYTAERDGIDEEWAGLVFLNPPGGVLVPSKKKVQTAEQIERDRRVRERWKTKSSAVAWWRKLVHEFDEQRVTSAVFVGFTLQILQAAQASEFASPLEYTTVVLADRVAFDVYDELTSNRTSGEAPPHGNFVTLLTQDKRVERRFVLEFGNIGAVVAPYR